MKIRILSFKIAEISLKLQSSILDKIILSKKYLNKNAQDCNAYDELKNDEFLCEAFKSRTETDAALCASNFGRVEHGKHSFELADYF